MSDFKRSIEKILRGLPPEIIQSIFNNTVWTNCLTIFDFFNLISTCSSPKDPFTALCSTLLSESKMSIFGKPAIMDVQIGSVSIQNNFQLSIDNPVSLRTVVETLMKFHMKFFKIEVYSILDQDLNQLEDLLKHCCSGLILHKGLWGIKHFAGVQTLAKWLSINLPFKEASVLPKLINLQRLEVLFITDKQYDDLDAQCEDIKFIKEWIDMNVLKKNRPTLQLTFNGLDVIPIVLKEFMTQICRDDLVDLKIRLIEVKPSLIKDLPFLKDKVIAIAGLSFDSQLDYKIVNGCKSLKQLILFNISEADIKNLNNRNVRNLEIRNNDELLPILDLRNTKLLNFLLCYSINTDFSDFIHLEDLHIHFENQLLTAPHFKLPPSLKSIDFNSLPNSTPDMDPSWIFQIENTKDLKRLKTVYITYFSPNLDLSNSLQNCVNSLPTSIEELSMTFGIEDSGSVTLSCDHLHNLQSFNLQTTDTNIPVINLVSLPECINNFNLTSSDSTKLTLPHLPDYIRILDITIFYEPIAQFFKKYIKPLKYLSSLIISTPYCENINLVELLPESVLSFDLELCGNKISDLFYKSHVGDHLICTIHLPFISHPHLCNLNISSRASDNRLMIPGFPQLGGFGLIPSLPHLSQYMVDLVGDVPEKCICKLNVGKSLKCTWNGDQLPDEFY